MKKILTITILLLSKSIFAQQSGEDIFINRVEGYRYSVCKVYDESVKNLLSTAFIVSKDGYIITTYHTIRNNPKIKIRVFTGYDKEEVNYPAAIIATEETLDLAILKINGKNFQPLKLVINENYRLGFDIACLGYPYGPYSVTKGILSAISFMPIVDEKSNKILTWKKKLVLDITTNSGSSGSPVFVVMSGEVLGFVVGRYDPLNQSDVFKMGDQSILTSATRLGVATNLFDCRNILKKYKIID